jgi:hypothetical protein
MQKVFLSGVVFVALLVVGGKGPDVVVAQNTKKPAATAAGAGVIEIGEGKDGKFRFFVRNDEGKLVAMSSPGGFATVDDAKAGIQHLKEIVKTAKVTMLKKKSKEEK